MGALTQAGMPTDPSPAAVVSKAVARAAEHLGLTNVELGQTIGVSAPTVSRMKTGNYQLTPGSKPYELALLLVRLFRGLDAIMVGDQIALRSWMGTMNKALRGVPRDLVQTASGLVSAVDYVDAARARI